MNALLRFFTIFVFVSLCHAALATEKITAKNEEQFLLLEFDDEVFCKKAKDILEERLLAKDGSLNNLMDWKYHEWFGVDDYGQKRRFHHGEYVYVDYDGDGHRDMLIRRNTTVGKDIWFHHLEIFDAKKFNAETTDIDPKNYWHHREIEISQVRLKNRADEVGRSGVKRSWIDAIWIEGKLYFVFIQSQDSAMYPYGGDGYGPGLHHKDYMKPYLMLFSIDGPNEKYKTSDIRAHCLMQSKNQIDAQYK